MIGIKMAWHLWQNSFIRNRPVANSSNITEFINHIEQSLLGMQSVFHPDLTGFNTAKTSGGKWARSLCGFPHKKKNLSSKVLMLQEHSDAWAFLLIESDCNSGMVNGGHTLPLTEEETVPGELLRISLPDSDGWCLGFVLFVIAHRSTNGFSHWCSDSDCLVIRMGDLEAWMKLFCYCVMMICTTICLMPVWKYLYLPVS